MKNTVSLRDYLDLRIEDTKSAANQRFDAQQLALKDALVSQEKAVSNALDGTKEAITKSDAATDKRFELLSEKIDGVSNVLNKNAGAQGIYVTHADLSFAIDKLQTAIITQLQPVIDFMHTQTGQAKGTSNVWGYIACGIGIVIGLIGIISFINSLTP